MREQKQVTHTLERRLASYALAAAGISAMVPSAVAQVIYTPTDLKLAHGGIRIDLNNDGQDDLRLVDRQQDVYAYYGGALKVASISTSPVVASVVGYKGKFGGAAYAAPSGFSIGPNSPQQFISIARSARMATGLCTYFYCRVSGPFANQKDKYLGVRFTSNGQTHYGWVRMTVNAKLPSFPFRPTVVAKITGYAYEATPDKAIIAGDRGLGSSAANSGTLGALALGAARSSSVHH